MQGGTIFGREPVAIVTVIMAVIALLATYGLNLVPDTTKFETAILLVLTILSGGTVIRSQVTPVKAPQLPTGTEVAVSNAAGQVIETKKL